jgi:hypothetical protein
MEIVAWIILGVFGCAVIFWIVDMAREPLLRAIMVWYALMAFVFIGIPWSVWYLFVR